MARRHGPGRRRGNSPRGRLRIVAGKWRSRLLPIADVPALRPTPERVRETLFNWLSPRIAGARCLDLYAGTGALGLEALSRGAAASIFVEKDRRAVAALRTALEELGAKGATVEAADAFDYLRGTGGQSVDVVFLDPPYADESLDELCRLLQQGGWLAPGAVVYFEQDRKQRPPTLPEGWSILRRKSAGQVRYSLASTAGSGPSGKEE